MDVRSRALANLLAFAVAWAFASESRLTPIAAVLAKSSGRTKPQLTPITELSGHTLGTRASDGMTPMCTVPASLFPYRATRITTRP